MVCDRTASFSEALCTQRGNAEVIRADLQRHILFYTDTHFSQSKDDPHQRPKEMYLQEVVTTAESASCHLGAGLIGLQEFKHSSDDQKVPGFKGDIVRSDHLTEVQGIKSLPAPESCPP